MIDQAESLRKIVSERVKEKRAKAHVIAIGSGKGGCGKTNLTLNLGLILSKNGKRTLIFDADLNLANVDILLGITPKYRFLNFINGDVDLKDVIVKVREKLELIPANSGIVDFSKVSGERIFQVLDEVLNLENNFDFILIDTPAGIDYLVDIGMIGLSDAIEKFDPKVGVKFETYAYTRISGCIIDEIRKLDNLPRSARNKIGLLDKARSRIENEIGDKAQSWKIADEVGISVEEYEKILKLEKESKTISFNLNVGENIELGELIKSEDKNPEETLLENEIKQAIAEELKKLSERERLVIVLYYYEELTFKEIAEILKLSESRVSQIHSEAMNKIRNSLKSKLSL
jgi:RNA polymerase sigma factor for flagellar operon FliA